MKQEDIQILKDIGLHVIVLDEKSFPPIIHAYNVKVWGNDGYYHEQNFRAENVTHALWQMEQVVDLQTIEQTIKVEINLIPPPKQKA